MTLNTCYHLPKLRNYLPFDTTLRSLTTRELQLDPYKKIKYVLCWNVLTGDDVGRWGHDATFFRNVDNRSPNYMTSHNKTPIQLLSWEPKISWCTLPEISRVTVLCFRMWALFECEEHSALHSVMSLRLLQTYWRTCDSGKTDVGRSVHRGLPDATQLSIIWGGARRRTNRHISKYILVINQLDAQNLFYNKFISCLYMFRAPCVQRQEIKIVLYSLWYHHTNRYDDTRGCIIQFWPPDDEHIVLETCRGMK